MVNSNVAVEQQKYVEHCGDAIDRNLREDMPVDSPRVEGLERYLTGQCTECGGVVEMMDEREKLNHRIYRGFVLVGCEGYWIINPEFVGMGRGHENWGDWTEEDDTEGSNTAEVGNERVPLEFEDGGGEGVDHDIEGG